MRVVDVSELPGLVGKDLGVSDWVLVDQPLIDRFADLTHDHQWIHVDVERAKREIGGTIAHGFLTLSLMSRMMHQIIEIKGYKRSINYGFNKLRFTGAVPGGARIRLRAKLIAVEPKDDRVTLLRECTVEVEGNERPAVYAEWVTLLIL
ncbi:MAG TPA: MaoC family dehydratase [Xanthobacteraceae bacterium]|nr:MaoC family dehydratase [Xanthobacteraceae bacterium]